MQVLDVIAPPYTSDFVQLFLPILENDSIAGTIRTEGEHDPVAEFIGTFQAAVFNKRWCFSFSCEGLRNQTSRFQYGPNSFHCSCSASTGAKKKWLASTSEAALEHVRSSCQPFYRTLFLYCSLMTRHAAILPDWHSVLYRCQTLAVILAY